MTVIAMEGFDAWSGTTMSEWCFAASQNDNGLGKAGNNACSYVTGAGGAGTQAIRFATSAALNLPGGIYRSGWTANTHIYWGFYYYLGAANVNNVTANTWHPFTQFSDSTGQTSANAIRLEFELTTHELRFYNPNAASDFSTATSGLSPDPYQSWVYFEVHIYQESGGTGGILRCDMDGTTVINATGLDLRSTVVGANWTTFHVHSTYVDDNNRMDCDVDDLYIEDSQLLGPSYVSYLKPNHDGGTLEWTPSTGTSHFATVDELPESTTDDNSVTSSASATKTDLLDTVGDTLPFDPQTIHSVEGRAMMHSATGSCPCSAALIRSGTNYWGASALNVGTTNSYTPISRKDLDPNGGIAWTRTAVEACGVGYRTEIDATTNSVLTYAAHICCLHSVAVASGGGGGGSGGTIVCVYNG